MPDAESSGSVERRWEVLYRRFRSRLVAQVRARTGDDAFAEDVAHDVLMAARSHLVAGRPTPTWPSLSRTAERLTQARRARDTVVVPLPPPERLGELLSHAEPDEELLATVQAALDRLPVRERLALSFLFDEGWSPSAVAFLLDLDEAAFGRVVTRARNRLRAEVRRLGRPLVVVGPLSWARRRVRVRPDRLHAAVLGEAGALVRVGGLRPTLIGATLAAVLAAGNILVPGPPSHPDTPALPVAAGPSTSPSDHAAPTAGEPHPELQVEQRAAPTVTAITVQPRIDARQMPETTRYRLEPVQAPPPTTSRTADDREPVSPGAGFECPEDADDRTAVLTVGCPLVDLAARGLNGSE